MWRCSKEAMFLRTILKCRMEWKEHDFADHVYWWNQVMAIKIMLMLMT